MNQPVRVLLVEDDALAADVIQYELKKVGLTVVGEAYDGLEAICVTKELRPDVVLMDVRMPRMNGLEAAARIQAECPTPVVLLTAYDDPVFVERASHAGVGAYVLKPPNAREIERAITVAVARFADQQHLRQLNADLAAYDRSVSHDLRNALGFLSMSTEMLLESGSALDAEDLQIILRQMNATSERSLNVVDSLLWLAQPETLPLMRLNVESIVDSVCSVLYIVYQDRAPEIVRVVKLPDAVGHAGLVERVWDNYISNAIKYAGRPARIELGGQLDASGQVRYWVRDFGNGVPPEMQPHLFDPFVRLEEGAARGYGLGLPLVKRIVERLGGVCGVESSGEPGAGALFYFTLPATSDDGEPANLRAGTAGCQANRSSDCERAAGA